MGSRTGKKPQVPATVKLAMKIVPLEQASRRDYVECGVANHTDEDQRAMVRSKETKTIRKKTRIERMVIAGLIDKDQQNACEWYANAFELGYATVGCTANYCGAGGGGFGSSDLFARYKAQQEAREDYAYARKAIPGDYLKLFDYVLFGHEPDFKALPEHMRNSISLAAWLLHGQIGHMLLIAA
jgi:hypothetical protein